MTLLDATASTAARRAILGRLRSAAPAQPLPTPDLTPFFQSPFGRGVQGERPAPADLIAPFEAAARGWRAEVLHASPANWPAAVQQVLQQRGCRHLAVGQGFPGLHALTAQLAPQLGQGLTLHPFASPLEDWKPQLFDQIDAGLTCAAAGVADTGSLVLQPGPGEPRTLSLVPPLHIAVLPARRLYASLAAAWAALQPQADMPTNLLLISGPSKTADIQQVLAFGAHGPKELVIVLVNDLQNDAEVCA